jgi:enoyl-CoA hydratase/carnithine racemase
MILGEIFDGKRAVELGIMSKVVPDSQLMEEAKAAARAIAQAAPIALRFLKEGVAMSIKGTYAEAKAKEVELVRKIYQTEDSQEGLAALLEDRKPNFKGR